MSDPSGLRVLIVDDNEINRLVAGLLLDTAGIAHCAVENGLLGLEAAKTGEFGMILMDIQMPVMDGLEAIRHIRAWEQATDRPRMPIHIVSANCMAEDVKAGAAAGADGHLSKPVSLELLLAAVGPSAIAAARLAA